jgi:hypothetical protein
VLQSILVLAYPAWWGTWAVLVVIGASVPIVGRGLTRRVRLFHYGVEVQPWLGPTQALLFEERDAVYRHVDTLQGTFQTLLVGGRLVLEAADGRRVAVDARVSDAEPLFRALIRDCVRPVYSEAWKAFRQGEELAFGRMRLTREALTIGDETLAWEDVERVEFSPKVIRIHRRHRFFVYSVSFERTPFLLVLSSLMEGAGVRLRGHRGVQGPRRRRSWQATELIGVRR